MSSLYVVMKKHESPIAITYPKPHEVLFNLKDAKRRVAELNEKATTNTYWYERVKEG